MSSALSVAVIIPVYNEAGALPEMIDQMRRSGADEIIVVDGGSSDRTPELLVESGLRFIAAGRGRAMQMNAGASLCGSDILLFIHIDTKINSGHVEAVKAVMRTPDVVGGRFDVRLSGAHPAFRIIEWFMNQRSRLTGISTGDQCIFVRRSVFRELGGFPEQPLMEDIEFSKRLKRTGRIACLRERVITSSRRWEQHGIVRTVLLMWKLRLLYRLGVAPGKLALLYRDAR